VEKLLQLQKLFLWSKAKQILGEKRRIELVEMFMPPFSAVSPSDALSLSK
jgi:hypothetical protein